MPKWGRLAVLALIVVVGAALRVWGIAFGLPHDLARPDEEKIAHAVFGILHGDLNPHFFLYPSLFVYLTAAAYAVLVGVERALGALPAGTSLVASAMADPSALHVVARGLAAASGIATIVVLYAAASEFFSRRTALVSAAFLATAFLHVRDSHFGVTDVPSTLLIVCAFWASARIVTKGITLPRSACAGLLCGLAASTKYNAVLIAMPAAIAFVGGIPGFRREPARLPIAATVAFATCLALGFVIATPFAVLDWPAFLADVEAQRRILSGGGHGGSIIDPAREVYGGVPGWTHHLTVNLRYGLGLPLLVTGILGAGLLAIDEPRVAAVVLSFPVAYYAAIGISALAYARYMVPLVPFLCLTAGVAVDRLASAAASRVKDHRVSAFAAIVLVVAVGSPTAVRTVAFDRLVARTDTRVLAARWIEARYAAGATLYQTGTSYGFVQLRPSMRFPQPAFATWPGFIADQAVRGALPDLVVVLDSPLVIFSRLPAEIWPTLRARYVQVATFRGIAADDPSDAIYDQQDAFYVPYAHAIGIHRPGPTVQIFERRHDEPS